MRCNNCEHLRICKPDEWNEGYAYCEKYDVHTILIGKGYVRKINRLECYGEEKKDE